MRYKRNETNPAYRKVRVWNKVVKYSLTLRLPFKLNRLPSGSLQILNNYKVIKYIFYANRVSFVQQNIY